MRLLLIDDHPLFALCFKQAVMQAGAGVHVDSAATIDDGLRRAAWGSHDIVLIDDRLTGTDGTDGVEAVRRFGTHFPLLARVLISGASEAVGASRASVAGASGFLGKSQSIDQLLAGLRSIWRADSALQLRPAAVPSHAAGKPTARQHQVLALLAQGQPNKRIASALGISERTVKLHMTGLLQALGARNRTHLLVVGREKGLL